ncbi:MAG: acyl-CoA dehydrogenase [Desulfobacterales bacterium]|jgi:alkylation response protein AidB-like acyl-CoA dehydrogenase|nr:acyl-CoA dehydrogenase [Desulfobacteraceae bacterium]MBT7698442.1 acyl-CoA dehydrogenase [Desulfobacterales bacterium]
MTQLLVDRRDFDFVLYEMLNIEELCKYEKFKGFNKKTIDMVIKEARNLAIKEFIPINKEGDKAGCKFENGKVTIPEAYHRVIDLYIQGEWSQLGAQGCPSSVNMAVSSMFNGACATVLMYPGLSFGAAFLIGEVGGEALSKRFAEKIISGEWGGTMVLTESGAGTDLGELTTSAKKNPDGTYSITGDKIFISGGEQDINENIIHTVLARIEGAPKGTKGISLFVIPKIWVNEDGSLGEPNDVVCTGIEEKLGIHGSATCSLTFGGNGKCRGILLAGGGPDDEGKAGEGLAGMFKLMNIARLGVGMQGYALASSAYLYSLDYARERIQGKNLEKMGENDPSVPIIQHPDIRRMLLWMKAHIDGMRGLLFYTANMNDIIAVSEDGDEKAERQGIVDFIIPVIKAYCTDKAFEVCTQALQVYGGYGYTKEYPVEQLLRDSKIFSIYEGANGIQSIDLLGRKLAMNNGKAFMDFLGEIKKAVGNAKNISGLEDQASRVDAAANKLAEVALHLGTKILPESISTGFSFSKPFLDITGDVIMAWMLLWRSTVASQKIEKANKKDKVFYEGQVMAAEYFIYSVLPSAMGAMDAIINGNDAVVKIADEAFG